MPSVNIKNTKISYEDADVITLEEGLIGLPGLRQMVLVGQSTIDPFMWLASVDISGMAFLVIDPKLVYTEYALTPLLEDIKQEESEEDLLMLALVKLESEWAETTINLRAPVVINRKTKRGAQIVLTDSDYSLTEHLPTGLLAD